MVKPGLSGLAVLEHQLELGQNHVPISTTGSPVFDNFPAGQVEHFAQGIIVGEAGLVLGDLPELAVQALDDISRVYDFPNLGGVCAKKVLKISQLSSQLFTQEGYCFFHFSLNVMRFSRASSSVIAV